MVQTEPGGGHVRRPPTRGDATPPYEPGSLVPDSGEELAPAPNTADRAEPHPGTPESPFAEPPPVIEPPLPPGALRDAMADAGQKLRAEVRERSGPFFTQQKLVMAGQAKEVAAVLRVTERELAARRNPVMARYVAIAADGLERFSSTLTRRDVDSLFDDIRDFARRRPAVVAGGALAAGFILARLIGGAESAQTGAEPPLSGRQAAE